MIPPVLPLSEYNLQTLPPQLAEWGFLPSHAKKLLRCYYDHAGNINWSDIELPRALKQQLSLPGSQMASEIAARQVASDGTVKLLVKLADGRAVESVMMPDYREDRVAGCLSSQVGCAMGCDFCATTQTGFQRNLSAGEMVEQFLHLRRQAMAVQEPTQGRADDGPPGQGHCIGEKSGTGSLAHGNELVATPRPDPRIRITKPTGRRLRTVVFMGMGEPMLNLDNVLEAVRRIAADQLGALGWRQITISTVGIVPGIDAMTEAALNINLAISLHAPDDATRARLLPTGRRFAITDIMAAADRYQAKTGRPVTIQYCLLKGVNDSPDQARMLAELLQGRRMHVNLLYYNATGLSLTGQTYTPSDPQTADTFLEVLRGQRVVSHIRRSRGKDIDAACGQLRHRIA